MSSLLQAVVTGFVLCLVQFLAAVPWLAVVDPRAFRHHVRRPASWGIALGSVLGAGIALGIFIQVVRDPASLLVWGRFFGALLNAQLIVDFFVFLFPILMYFWPQGAAVALAAFREGVRQPMFWMIVGFAVLWLVVSPFLPYYTFGEDFKMMKELGYDTTMLASVLFAVLAASMSISEEIEGRTAITVMSKPVSRRQFLLGKFLGTLFAALLMTAILGWVFNGVLWLKLVFDREPAPNPNWLEPARQAWAVTVGEAPLNFVLGHGVWFSHILAEVPGLVFGFCQVMVLLAIAVALATRLPMVVNLVTCLLIFFLGHLTHVLVQVSQGRYELVSFIAKFFDIILPGLEYFDLGPIIVRDIPPDPQRFTIYLGSVVLYAVLYSVIALLFGLILFEDRDLA